MSENERGFTLVELVVSISVLSITSVGFFGLLIALTQSAVTAKRQSVALTLATTQMEYVKSLPYNNVAVAGGAIPSSSPIPAQYTKKVNGENYKIVTSVTYADDAFDGCGSYPTTTLKQQYCRNFPAPTGAPATDTNPADYKSVSVSVRDLANVQLAIIDTNVSALVAETASNTGAIFVRVIDGGGNPVSAATVSVTNVNTTPAVNVSDVTDDNGIIIFYGLPPSATNYRYVINATKNGHSSLTTIAPSGSLQPTYSSQNLIAQNSSYVTMLISPQAQNSLVVEATDTSGNPLNNARVYIKGGYKRYVSAANTAYYYDNLSPSDIRPVTNASGEFGVTGLAPGNYFFCGDADATSCTVGGTTYYLAAALPYGESNPFTPTAVPTSDASALSFAYNGNNYVQKVRLLMTPSSTHPRISTMSPYSVSKAGITGSSNITISGANLPCSSSPGSCATTVVFSQGGTNYAGSCTGAAAGTSISCNVNFTGIDEGPVQVAISANGNTLTLPASASMGGFRVTP